MNLLLVLFSFITFSSLVNSQGQPKKSDPLYVEISQFRWVNDRVSVFLTTDRRLYKSDNEGGRYTDITGDLYNASYRNQAPEFIYVSDTDPSRIYVRGRGSISWRSTDYGNDWEEVYPRASFRNFVWHPSDPDCALAAVADSSFSRTAKLYITRDFGNSWNLVHSSIYNGYPTSYGWADAGKGTIPTYRIYYILATTERDGNNQREAYHFQSTDDFGTTSQMVMTHCYAFVVMKRHIFIATYTVTELETVLKVTYDIGDPGKRWAEAEFPFGDELEYNGFVLLDDSSGGVYVAVSHLDPQAAKWGNIYISDSTGADYAISLEHVAQDFPIYDFDVLNGLEGAYLANYVSNWNSDDSKARLETRLSYNNGGNWVPLNPPATDVNGRPYSCGSSHCYLHLHGWTNDGLYGPFYTRASAIGVVVATGNVGTHLSTDLAQTSTFLSRDGGITWSEIAKDNYIYEIGDHGGLIVFASLSVPTDTIYYTTTEATTPLQSFRFIANTLVNVENIVIEPSATGRKFVIYGSSEEEQPRGVLISVDFTSLQTRECGDDDYEIWSPGDGRSTLHDSPCMLGHVSYYKRRKPTADCFNERDTDHKTSQENCECTIEDYECDYGYQPNENEDACVLVNPSNAPSYPPLKCPPGTKYNVTKGYRLTALNTCEGGLDLKPIPTPCPGSPSQNSEDSPFNVSEGKGWVIAVIVVTIVFAICCVIGIVFAVMNSQRLRAWLPFAARLSGKMPYFNKKEPNTLFENDDYEIHKADSDDEKEMSHKEPDLIKIVESNKTPFSLNDDDFNPRKQ